MIDGHAIAGREVYTKNVIKITYDENGFTADQTLYFEYEEGDTQRIWSVHINGLNGTTSVVRSTEGQRDVFKTVTEGSF